MQIRIEYQSFTMIEKQRKYTNFFLYLQVSNFMN